MYLKCDWAISTPGLTSLKRPPNRGLKRHIRAPSAKKTPMSMRHGPGVKMTLSIYVQVWVSGTKKCVMTLKEIKSNKESNVVIRVVCMHSS